MMVDHSPPANPYFISRPIYSKRAFDKAYQRQMLESRTFREKLSTSCRCLSSQVKPTLKGLLPILDWLLKYPVKLWLLSDIISGASTGLVCCFQGLVYALLVSVGPLYGLYAAFFPILTYFFLGTSRHISVGPFPVTCLMVGSVVLTLTPDEQFIHPGNRSNVNGSILNIEEVDINAMEAQRIAIASTMTVLIGLFQLAMGMLHVGFLVRYLSDPLVGGFITEAAFHVFISQLKMIVSVPTHSHNGFFSVAYTLSDVFRNIEQTNVADLVGGLLTIIIVVVVKEVNIKFQHKIPVPVPIKVIVELIAFGISNIFCGCFSGFVSTTALSRTAIQEGAGGKTQVAGLISALMMFIIIMGLGPLLQPLQNSVLAGIVIANLKGMFTQFNDVPILWRQNRTDCYIWVFTCIACIMHGLDVGLLTAIVFELGTVVARTQ